MNAHGRSGTHDTTGAAAAPLLPDPGHVDIDTQLEDAGAGTPLSGDGHDAAETQHRGAAPDTFSPDGQRSDDTQAPLAAGDLPADALLLIYADALDDLERVRIATENRARSLRQIKGMEDSPEEARMLGLVEAIGTLEHQADLELRRALRKHPLGPWVKRTIGIGEKQGARLLAAIGDPAERRTVSQLWAFCGYHVIDGEAARRRKGQKANWSNTAKMRAFLVAESCIKHAQSPYRKVYDAGRAKYADAVHDRDCVRCGPAGKPAPAGSLLSPGHQHARALRLVAKAVLRDLWIEARAVEAQQARLRAVAS